MAWFDTAPGWQIVGALVVCSAALLWTLERLHNRYRGRHRHGWRPTPEALDRIRGVSQQDAGRRPDGPAP